MARYVCDTEKPAAGRYYCHYPKKATAHRSVAPSTAAMTRPYSCRIGEDMAAVDGFDYRIPPGLRRGETRRLQLRRRSLLV